MNKAKVNDFLNVYSRVMGLKEDVKNILIELMENIIIKYEKVVDYIPVTLDDSKVYLINPINNRYTVEDFFLNRLMRNVWDIEIAEKIDEDDPHLKGSYSADSNTVNINRVKLATQLEKYKDILGDSYYNLKFTAGKKLIMHEFEHAMQTRFDNKLDYRYKEKYKKISEEIQKLGKYDSIITPYDLLPVNKYEYNNYLSTGVHYSDYSNSLGIKTYRNIDGSEELNEILNESESLEMAGSNAFLTKMYSLSGNYYPMQNPESSNSVITNYGFIIKLLLGEKICFEAMYLNPSVLFEKFNNEYNYLFQEMYNSEKDAIEILMGQLDLIKRTEQEEDILKLNEIFAKCLKLNIEKGLSDIGTVEQFSNYIVKNNDINKNNQLNHIIIINELKTKLQQPPKIDVNQNREKQLINSINSDLLNKKIRFGEYSEISFRQYLEEAFFPFIPESDFVVLSNGISIPIRQYIEEVVYSNAEKYGRNIENLIKDTIEKKANSYVGGAYFMKESNEYDYKYFLEKIMKIIENRRKLKESSIEIPNEEKEDNIFEIHENIKLMNKSIKSIDDISKIFDYVIENIGIDTFENKISNDILSSLPIKQFKEVKSNEISDNLNSKILYFVNKCKTLENSYIEFKNNNLKDTETLKELISNNYLLKEEGILLLSQNISDEERKIINYNIMLLQEQEENMKKFNFNLEETIDDFNRKL